MSSLERFAVVTLLAACLGGCTLTPLYAPGGLVGGGRTATTAIGDDLARVTIAEQNSRVGIGLRNELIHLFGRGGNDAVNPLYRLDLNVTSSAALFTIQPGTGLARTASVAMTTRYDLVRLADGQRIHSASATSRANYDRGVQRFANIRAERDAEDRAARETAETIRNGLAIYFARQRTPGS